ncbi:MAG: WbqC family protein [Elusimicrobiota bacterium]
MILAVHQPQYLPWLGYFHKIANCDLFIFLDDVQYKKREFQNRNKIKTPNGPLWLTVPVATKGKYSQKISEVTIDKETGWNNEHWKSVEHNYAHARFFSEHKTIFSDVYGMKWDKLIDLSMKIIENTLSYLDIKTPCKMSSEYGVTSSSTQRIIDLCKKTGADTYLSGAGGREYMDEKLFTDNNIRLTYQDYKHPEYEQLHGKFEPYLSVIDLLMNCGPQSRGILLG